MCYWNFFIIDPVNNSSALRHIGNDLGNEMEHRADSKPWLQ